MQQKYGIPVATANNVVDLLHSFGIKPWKKTHDAIPLTEYAKQASPEQQMDIERFGPKAEAVEFEQPNGQPYVCYRTRDKDWATVFTLLPGDLVPVVGEWKQGAEALTIIPPSGVPSKADNGSLLACGKREFEEETGFELSSIEPLLPEPRGIPISCRKHTTRFLPCLGHIQGNLNQDFRPGPTKLDQTEYLKMILLPLEEWMRVIESGLANEECAISTTFLALRRLGRMTLLLYPHGV